MVLWCLTPYYSIYQCGAYSKLTQAVGGHLVHYTLLRYLQDQCDAYSKLTHAIGGPLVHYTLLQYLPVCGAYSNLTHAIGGPLVPYTLLQYLPVWCHGLHVYCIASCPMMDARGGLLVHYKYLKGVCHEIFDLQFFS